MRGTRWLLLVVITAILGAIAIKYRAQKDVIRAQALPKPQALPEELNASGDHYDLTKRSAAGRCPVFHVYADSFRQSKDSSHVDLVNVEVQTFNKECTGYNLSRSAAATFFANENRLYSEGDAEITLNIPIDGKPKHTPVTVKTSGVLVDVVTGRAETDRPSTFLFENGSGKATGAFYDPTTHELQLKSGVEVNWKAPAPHAKATKIESSSLVYHEANSEILLNPWGRMTRGDTVVEGENVVVHLKQVTTAATPAVSSASARRASARHRYRSQSQAAVLGRRPLVDSTTMARSKRSRARTMRI